MATFDPIWSGVRRIAQAVASGEASAVEIAEAHVARMEALEPELNAFITRNARAVDDARTEFSQQRSRLQAADEAQGDVPLPEAGSDVSDLIHGGRSLGQWMKIGFAFTLPLIAFGFIALLIFFWVAGKVQ